MRTCTNMSFHVENILHGVSNQRNVCQVMRLAEMEDVGRHDGVIHRFGMRRAPMIAKVLEHVYD